MGRIGYRQYQVGQLNTALIGADMSNAARALSITVASDRSDCWGATPKGPVAANLSKGARNSDKWDTGNNMWEPGRSAWRPQSRRRRRQHRPRRRRRHRPNPDPISTAGNIHVAIDVDAVDVGAVDIGGVYAAVAGGDTGPIAAPRGSAAIIASTGRAGTADAGPAGACPTTATPPTLREYYRRIGAFHRHSSFAGDTFAAPKSGASWRRRRD